MPKAFNCTMCSAPLDLTKSDGMTVRCHYCGNSAILPDELRDHTRGRPKPSPGGTLLSIIDRGLKMAEVSQLIHAGNKIGAIKLYRETFGGSLEEAKTAVEQMERSQGAAIMQAGGGGHPAMSVSAQTYPQAQFVQPQPTKSYVGYKLIGVAIVLLIVFGVSFAIYKAISKGISQFTGTTSSSGGTTSGSSTPGTPSKPGFASVALEIGSEGMGAGQFKDVRSVAVDGEGRIYTVEYIGGRVQVFDPQGKFITQWMIDPKSATLDIEADRKGVVYIVQPRATYRHNAATGELLGQLVKPPTNSYDTYYDVEVGLDGSIYAISGHHKLVRINADNTFKSEIDLREKTGEDSVSFDKLAVDGAGNIYVMGRSEKTIFKFAPDGRFINRFGGSGDGPGQFRTGNGIAVDGQGRIYVSDSGRPVQVFDNQGRYLDSFGGEHPVIYGMAVNDQNEIFVTERNRFKVIKYALTGK
jgi:sugar lactone lactonase YvrE